MDEEGTPVDSTNHTRLISVSSGKTCRLVGVSNSGWGYHEQGAHYGQHGYRRKFGWFSKHGEQWEQRKVRWHQKGERQVAKRLLDLGLTKGCTFKVVQGGSRGPVLVEVRGTRIALGHGLARKVIVEVLGGQA